MHCVGSVVKEDLASKRVAKSQGCVALSRTRQIMLVDVWENAKKLANRIMTMKCVLAATT